jgi:hypothetical protein
VASDQRSETNRRRAPQEVDRDKKLAAVRKNHAAATIDKTIGENMKNRFFLTISAMMVSAALLLSATAQTKIDIGKQVMLQCKVGTPVEFPTITITNNTNKTVPTGKKIYWQANSLMKGWIVLSAPLAPGESVTTSSEAKGTSYNPAAWYFQ